MPQVPGHFEIDMERYAEQFASVRTFGGVLNGLLSASLHGFTFDLGFREGRHRADAAKAGGCVDL